MWVVRGSRVVFNFSVTFYALNLKRKRSIKFQLNSPGFGDSDKPSSVSEYRMATIVEELRRLLETLTDVGGGDGGGDDQKRKKRVEVTLMGHGLGGTVAWHFIDRCCGNLYVSFCTNAALVHFFQTSRPGRQVRLRLIPSPRLLPTERRL